jgi:hypothetical protein
VPRPTRRWSFLLGVLLVVAGLALMAKPLVAGPTASGSTPSAAEVVAAAADDADCCRNDRRCVDFDPAPALGMLGIGGALMLVAAIAAGVPSSRRLG